MWLIDWFKWLVLPSNINLNVNTLSLKVWNTYQLTATLTPQNSTNKKLIWSSSDASIANVDDEWLITWLQDWECVITVTTEYWWYTDTCNCTLYVIHTTWVSLSENNITILKWKTHQLTATVTPADTSYPDVTWYSSNTSVATVSSNGLVTYVWDWDCIITATTVDWWYTASCTVTTKSVPPVYFSEANFNEYQNLVDTIWSVNFCDTGCRFRFNNWVYIWNRTALDFNWSTMRKINLDTLAVTCSKSSTINWRVRYFWDNRILTRNWIADFDWNIINSFTYCSITPWDECIVWANCNYDIYKWVVNWDCITFTKVGTWWSDQSVWGMFYWHCGAYLLNSNDTKWSCNSSYINPTTNALSNFTWAANGRWATAVAWADWKEYRMVTRCNWFGRLQKIWTWNEWIVWDALCYTRTQYWTRFGKFLWNVVSGGMWSNNWTGNWYWSNNYFINTNWTLTKVQTNAFAYDTNINWQSWFIDEKWRLYPSTSWWWSWVILKTNCTFTDLNRQNPYLWR